MRGFCFDLMLLLCQAISNCDYLYFYEVMAMIRKDTFL